MWEKIKMQLDKKRWNAMKLAKISGVHAAQLSDLKRGKTKTLSWKNMVKIADALGVSLDVFR